MPCDGMTIIRRITTPTIVTVHDQWGVEREVEAKPGQLYVECANHERALITEREHES